MPIFPDRCRKCGADIREDGGALFEYLCDDCMEPEPPWLSKPAPAPPPVPKKESVMKKLTSYISTCIPDLVGRFRRNADGSVECTGLALATDPAGVARVATVAVDPDVRVAAGGYVRLAEGESYLGRDAAGRDLVRRAPWTPTAE